MAMDDYLAKLKEWGVSDDASYRDAAFSRNIGLFSPGEQERLSRARVAIPGMGGVGGVHLVSLVRTGIGKFNLADFDRYEPVNVNRQYGAKVGSFGRPKLQSMIGEALDINPFLDISPFAEGLTQENMESFLEGVDVVLDGLDFFQFEIRRALFNKARAMGVPVITAGPLGFSSALLIFTPEGMGFDDYFAVGRDMPEEAKYLRFAMGLAPRPTHIRYMDLSRVDLKGGKGPSLNIACQLCSSLAVTEAVRIILGRPGLKPAPHFLQFDPFLGVVRKGNLAFGNRSLIQRAKLWYVRNVLLASSVKAKAPTPIPPAPVDDSGTLTSEQVAYLLRAAIQAPSGDNVQPWRFRHDGQTISVMLDPAADQSFFNVRQVASIISCGAAIENIVLAANAIGLKAETSPGPHTSGTNLMGTVTVRPGNVAADLLSRQIWSRSTNRRPYTRRPLPDWVQEDLHARIGGMPGVRLHVLTERQQLRRLARVVYRADRIRSERRDLHEYFSSMVRFDEAEIMKRRDGLPLKNLEAGLTGELFLRMTKPWSVMNAANSLGFGRMVALHSAQGILASGAAGLVVVDGTEPEDFLGGGRALQRVWLTLEHHGLQMQPMTAVTLFWLRWLWEGETAFAESHRQLLEKVWVDFQKLFTQVDFSKQGLIMLFRTGYGPAIRHRTYRKELQDFVEK